MPSDSGRREHEPLRPRMEYDGRPDDGSYTARCSDCLEPFDENAAECPWCGARRRRFLTRQEATYALGLMCASQQTGSDNARLAMRHPDTGVVYEAMAGEVLHAQIALRVGGDYTRLRAGWTIPVEA